MLLNMVFLFAATVLSFTIPDGQANGVYMVEYDPEGGETHTFLSHLNESAPAPVIKARVSTSPMPAKRQIGGGTNSIS